MGPPADNGEVGDWLPPKPPVHFPGPRPLGEPPRPPAPPEPSSPLAIAGIALGAVSLLLLVFSFGAAFFAAALVSLMGLGAGRRATGRQARMAVRVAAIGLALAFVAGVVWMILDANGVSPQDLQDALQGRLRRHR